MLRFAVIAYALLSALLITTTLVTGRRATLLTGHPHYLFTRTVVLVQRDMPTDSETDAELDALFAEAGEETRMTVEEPMFVLGLLDATGPAVLAGGLLITGWAAKRRFKQRRGPGPAIVTDHHEELS